MEDGIVEVRFSVSDDRLLAGFPLVSCGDFPLFAVDYKKARSKQVRAKRGLIQEILLSLN